MKKIRTLAVLVPLLIFTGCSKNDLEERFESKLAEIVFDNSGISEDEDFLQYIELKQEGKLSEDGCYIELGEYAADQISIQNSENDELDDKRIHITFAQNEYLSVAYFYDAEMIRPIEDEKGCHLNPGESIYASVLECSNPYTNIYEFSEFRICEYVNGERNIRWSVPSNEDKESVKLVIPEDFTGTDLSIEPVGEYSKRVLPLNAYVIDRNGNDKLISSGIWKINGVEYSDTAEINPSDSYKVEYEYDENEYYFVDANPKLSNQVINTEGKVEFPLVTPKDETVSYSVWLHPYLRAVFDGDSDGLKAIKSVKVNNEEWINGTEIERLKVGDMVTIEVIDGYCLYNNLFSMSESNLDTYHRYSFEVPECDEDICLHVNKTVLKVEISSNVGSNILFDINAGSVLQSKCAYVAQSFNRDYVALDSTIGVEKTIEISAYNDGEFSLEQEAMRIDVAKTDNNNNKTREIFYISSLPGGQLIEVYKDGSVANFNKIYKSINIKISRVEVMAYIPQTIEHGSIEVRFTDVDFNKELQSGDVVEGTREVEVIITPDEGYYVHGNNVSEDTYTYRDTMDFKEYCVDITDIIKEHPIKKLIQVTLDTSDAYGECIFKVDGKAVSGTVGLREGQEIILEYTLTDSAYQIERESDSIFDNIIAWGSNTFSKDSESVKINIMSEDDGKVIKRDDYIQIDKR